MSARVLRYDDGAPHATIVCDRCGKRTAHLGEASDTNGEAIETAIAAGLFSHAGLGLHACGPRCGVALRDRVVS